MLRNRSSKIIIALIAAEAILIAGIVLVQQPFARGFLASTSAKPALDPSNVTKQNLQPATETPSATPANESNVPSAQQSKGQATSPAVQSSTPTPAVIDSQSPTLPPIKVVAPLPTADSRSAVVPPVPPINQQSAPGFKAARVVIQAIGVDSPVVEMGYTIVEENGQDVADWHVPDFAVGHMIGSANPGGQGNVVLSGHNNIFGAVFRKLYTLETGDTVTLYNAAGSGFLYRIAQAYIVQEEGAALAQRLANARVLLPTTDARVTLISCWPESGNSNRAIIIGTLVGTAQ